MPSWTHIKRNEKARKVNYCIRHPYYLTCYLPNFAEVCMCIKIKIFDLMFHTNARYNVHQLASYTNVLYL